MLDKQFQQNNANIHDSVQCRVGLVRIATSILK